MKTWLCLETLGATIISKGSATLILQSFVDLIEGLVLISSTVIGYSVKGTYQYITTYVNSLDRGMFDVVWQRQVPLKVSVFTWRILRDRLPTQDNLLRRGIIHQDDTPCIGGCRSSETAEHLLLRCDIFGSVWHYVYQCAGISFIAPPRSRRQRSRKNF